MTDILTAILKTEYPRTKDFDQVSIYGAHERIYLNLINEKFVEAPVFNNSNKIFQIAKKIFDVPFDFEKKGDVGEAIFFSPQINEEYHQNHFGHYIQVHLPYKYPLITISTGNRGAVKLFEKQRTNYLQFVKETYKLFIKNSKQQ